MPRSLQEVFSPNGSSKVVSDRVNVSAEPKAVDVITATMSVLFVGVKKGHPAYYR